MVVLMAIVAILMSTYIEHAQDDCGCNHFGKHVEHVDGIDTGHGTDNEVAMDQTNVDARAIVNVFYYWSRKLKLTSMVVLLLTRARMILIMILNMRMITITSMVILIIPIVTMMMSLLIMISWL